MSERSPEKRLDGFIAKFTPEVAARARAAAARMRALHPGALVLVYDNYNALAIGFGPTERASEAIFSIAVFPRWVSLFFLQGAGMRDPKGLLKGSGSRARHIVLKDAADLDDPAVRALMDEAMACAAVPLEAAGGGRIVIKSVSAKQRPRRPAKEKAKKKQTKRRTRSAEPSPHMKGRARRGSA